MNHKRILDSIESPQDLKGMSVSDLTTLCNELRTEMVKVTSQNGGHLASSLGAVETIVALHSLLDCPDDKIVFDVGHQAYAHKLLTGRRSRFSTLRQLDGITGFPNPDESPYDVHPSGHASDSLSIAMGLAKARDLSGTSNKIVALVGDAALSGGMAFEALNHIGQEQTPMVIVLNDNGMSISRPIGALVRHLGNLRASSQYRHTRDALQEAMEDRGPLTQGLLDLGRNMKESMKQFVIPHAMVFEQLGITCTAPVDGHDVGLLREMFSVALAADAPVLVHVVTRKGAGYAPAEASPEKFHGISAFDIKTGLTKKKPATAPTYTSAFASTLMAEAKADPDIVAITAAMKSGTGLADFAATYPERFIDTGITEEHALGLASGLAAGGKKPVVAIYSTFLQRAIDQVIIDNALPHQHTVLAIDRAGLVGDDGPTHNGVFDIAYLRMIPHMKIMAPSNEAELASALHTALADTSGPVALRYPRGEAEGAINPNGPETWKPGQSLVRRVGDDVAILAFGRLVNEALGAADLLAKAGIEARVVDMRWCKPLDEEAIAQAATTRLIVTAEEGVIAGGAGEGVLGVLAQRNLACPSLLLGIPDRFVEQGKIPALFKRLGLDAAGMARRIEQALRDKS
ncbi:1-deoxy-D-xylulose-5-phosphate synthase [Cryptobacterium curtum]|uniref:1-deoxy-D-xylulose-5-phosphate synthase n=1 Tax=Cryptobacterium curtum TaxID=84163 RepID=UPI00248DB6BB|nr:1-deoxy-D-xylulose-5-phosphate synthase [Cryptobacterium curtum]